MNRKTLSTIIIALLLVAVVALLWWWFLGRVGKSLPPPGGFGTAPDKNLSGLLDKPRTNVGLPTVGGLGEALPPGTYVLKRPDGTSLGSFDLRKLSNNANNPTYLSTQKPIPVGTYAIYNAGGALVGGYAVANAPLGGGGSAYTITPLSPITSGQYTLATLPGGTTTLGTFTLGPNTVPNVQPGEYEVKNLNGQNIGTYVVGSSTAIYFDNSTSTPNSDQNSFATSTPYLGEINTPDVNWYFSTTSTITFGTSTPGGGSVVDSPGTIFNPSAINEIAGSNPSGGLAPNFDEGTLGSVDKGGLGLAGALAGAAAGAAVSCALPFVASYIAGAVGITAGASFAGGGAVTSGAAAVAAAGPAAISALSAASPAAASAVGAATGLSTGATAATAAAPGASTAVSAAPAAPGSGGSALASVLVIDIPLVIGQIFQGLTLGGILAANTQSVGFQLADQSKGIMDCIFRTAGKAVVRVMTNSLVNWINSGFKGNPSFVSNPTQFFTNVADVAAGQFIKGSPLSFLCSPFKLQIKIAIAYSYAHQGQQCTLTGVVGNINNFINGSFGAGGWPTFLSFTMSANNNPFGAYAYSVNGLNSAVSQAQGNIQVQLNQGRGFLSLQQQQNCKTQSSAPTGVNSNQFVQSVGAGTTVDSKGNVSNGGIVLSGGVGNANKQSVTAVSDGSGLQGPTQSGAALGTAYVVCDLVTTTPGSVIAGTLDKAIGATTDSLNLAQSFDQVIAALIQQLMNAAQQGLSNLNNSGGGTLGTGAYYTADQQLAQATGQGLISKMRAETQTYQQIGAVLQGEISDIQSTQAQLNTLKDCWNAAVAKAQRVVNALQPPANQYTTDSEGGRFLNPNGTLALSPEMIAFNAASTTAHQNLAVAQARAQAIVDLNTQYEAKVTTLNNQITSINGGIAQLEQFQSLALSVGSSEDAAALTSQYLNAQVHPAAADLTTEQQNRTSLQTSLASDGTSIATSLNQCHAL